jgi:5'-nucleotidase
MRLQSVVGRGLTVLGAAIAATISVHAVAHNQSSHSLEADQNDARLEGAQARKQAAERVTWRDSRWKNDPVLQVKLLGINDFHGRLSVNAVGTRPAGGAAVLASYLRTASASAKDGAFIVHAGDHVGATPPNSALLQDEPAIMVLNELANEHCAPASQFRQLPYSKQAYSQLKCNVIGTFGNHEFDEGITEALRLVYGGNHSTGPFLEQNWSGAHFPYINANAISKTTAKSVLPPYTVKEVDGVRIGFIGAVLRATPTIVTPTGVAGLHFADEADTINDAAVQLKAQGVKTIIVTIHQGSRQTPTYEGPTDPATINTLSGPIVDIIKRLDTEIDVVISGHSHSFTNTLVTGRKDQPLLVTQAFSASTAYGDIDLKISRTSGDVVEKSAAVVTTWADQGPGLAPDVKVAQLVAAADERVAPLVNRLVGTATSAITRAESSAGESALGNLIADAQRVMTGADFAFMNPGGIREDLAAGEVTWGELFTIQPFGNDLVSMDLSGAQIKTLLEQQWQGQSSSRILKTSGLTYTYDTTRAVGDRVTQIVGANGVPVDPATTYRVTVNSFIAAGGDNFLVLVQGTNRVVGPVDLDVLVEYVESLPQPFSAAIEGRILRAN